MIKKSILLFFIIFGFSSSYATTIKEFTTQKDYGLVFIYSSTCPYCHKMVHVVEALQKKYDFEVYPISADAKALGSYSMFYNLTPGVIDRYYGSTRPMFPLLILQDLNRPENFYPIAQGYISLSQTEQNLKTVIGSLSVQKHKNIGEENAQ